MFPNWIPKTKSNGQVPGCNKISTEAVLESRTNTDAILTDINVTRLKDTDAYTFTQNDFVAQTLLHFFLFSFFAFNTYDRTIKILFPFQEKFRDGKRTNAFYESPPLQRS